ncbi:MAG TPA: hypothetical protein PL155_04960 [Candidatus Omnitrophota bacterium]|nr:hypothetical protein [Candidatus Omnitrophota bacterium]HPD84171.1 hypothetical protein [Candidatus Omnitrophota bacterium]HRZ03028.1 hypothetical protein [Candidatus Omnitrophota bacterium]
MEKYLNILHSLGLIVCTVTIIAIFSYERKKKIPSKNKKVGLLLLMLIYVYSVFTIIVPWKYMLETMKGLRYAKQLRFNQAREHYQKALDYKNKLGAVKYVYDRINVFRYSERLMNDDLDSWIEKCDQWNKELEQRKNEGDTGLAH